MISWYVIHLLSKTAQCWVTLTVEAAAATHLCDGGLDGHGMDPCHGWIATVLQAWRWGEVKKVVSGVGAQLG